MRRVTWKGVLQYVRISIILGLHALFVFLALVRATGDGDWGWYIAFIPLFIFDILSVVYWVIYLINYIKKWLENWDDDEYQSVFFPRQSLSLLVLIFYGVGIPLKIAAEILLLLHLREPGTIRVFIPCILFMLLFLEVGSVAVFYTLKPVVRQLREDW